MVCTIIWQLYIRKPLQQFRKMQIRRTIFRPRIYLRMHFGSYTLLGSVGTVFRQTRVIAKALIQLQPDRAKLCSIFETPTTSNA